MACSGIRLGRSPHDEYQIATWLPSGRSTIGISSASSNRMDFVFDRQEGDHLIYVKPGVRRPIVIPIYRAVPVFISRNLLRTSGMSRERYFELLKET
jgi:hypothetical protein